jgi:16S rRNA (cytosine967-C5)-methyltransferase
VRAGTPFRDAVDPAVDGLAERDRRLAYELSAGVLRRQAQLDRTLELGRADPRLHDVLRLGAYQLRCLTRVPPHAAVSTSVELARETAGEGPARFVNQALRKLTGTGYRVSGTGLTHPEWLVRRWTARFGAADTARLTAWNDTKPILTLQPARWDQETLAQRLRDAGFGVTESPFGAGLRINPAPGTRHPVPSHLPGFSEGAFIVQDPAHTLVCRFAAIPSGWLVYDACAAPGGKSVALEAGGREGRGVRVVAGDARRDRLPRLADTARRAGVAVRCVAADLEAAPFAPGRYDAVLVDAPCSATGTIRRHPDARWRLTPDLFARAAARQARLLAAAAPLVRPGGGLLIYATCSLEPEENTAVVEHFLSRHPEFMRARPPRPPQDVAVPAELLTAAGDFQSLPQRHGVDGAYAARLVRRA